MTNGMPHLLFVCSGNICRSPLAEVMAKAALSAEGMGSGATLEIGNGLYPGHADLVVDLLRRHPAVWGMLAPEATVAKGA